MNRELWRRCGGAGFFFVLVLILGGVAAAGQSKSGIGYDEYIRTFPPAPVRPRVEINGNSALLLRDLPKQADPSQKLSYDPAIAGFRVYRVGSDGGETLAGETKGTFLKLALPPAGTTQLYAVKTVQRSGHESGLSAEVAVSR